jgi:hypothetical protein
MFVMKVESKDTLPVMLVRVAITISVVRRLYFASDRTSYIVPRGNWCNIIALNVHVTSKEKSDYSKDSLVRNLRRFSVIFLSTRTMCKSS